MHRYGLLLEEKQHISAGRHVRLASAADHDFCMPHWKENFFWCRIDCGGSHGKGRRSAA